MFMFLGTKFWKFDPTQKPPVKSTYPKPISNWDGIPDNIDAALHYTNGYTYFFKDDNYYRFNDRTFAVIISFINIFYYLYSKHGIRSNRSRPPISVWSDEPDIYDTVSVVWHAQVDVADPPFPRNAGYWWFGCRAANKGHQDMTAASSVLKSTWMDIKRDHKGNQNTDVGDQIMDAG